MDYSIWHVLGSAYILSLVATVIAFANSESPNELQIRFDCAIRQCLVIGILCFTVYRVFTFTTS